MADFNTNDLVEVTYEITGPLNIQMRNVFNFRMLSSQTDTQVRESALLFWDDFYGPYWAFVPGDYVGVQAQVSNLTQVTEFDPVLINEAGSSPLAANAQMPPAASILLTAYTGVAGRRGRKFLPGIDEAFTGQGVLTNTTFLTALASTAAAWLLGLVTVSNVAIAEPGIIRRDTGAFLPIGSAVVRTLLSYLRSRKQGVGI